MYIRLYICTCIYIRIYNSCMYMCVSSDVYHNIVCVHIRTYVSQKTDLHIHVHTYTYVHTMYIHTCVVRMPFWMESSSGGRDSDVHLLISTSLVSIVSSRNGWLRGIFLATTSSCQSSRIIRWRKSHEKAPV